MIALNDGFRRFRQMAVIAGLRPYVSRELPGWGRLYRLLVGNHHRDGDWAGRPPCWVRGKLHGYEMRLDMAQWSNRQTFFLRRFYDLPTQKLMIGVLQPGDTAVDIGGNEGMISLLMSRLVGPRGRVVAFEPNPAPRAIFEQNLARNRIGNVTIHDCGLGDAPGVLPMFVPYINTGEGSFGAPDYAEDEGDVIQCPVRVADEVLADAAPILIKIDVEGFEQHVLRGAAQVIARSRPLIVMEMVDGHLARAGSSVASVVAMMTAQGYAGWRMGLSGGGSNPAVSFTPIDLAHGWTNGDVVWAIPGSIAEGRLKAMIAAA